jgi:hypothetical protein
VRERRRDERDGFRVRGRVGESKWLGVGAGAFERRKKMGAG